MHELQNKYEVEIEALVAASHRCAQLNYVTSAGGNLSARVDEDIMLVTPTKTPKRTMRFEDICIIDLQGNIVFAPEGKKPTGEWPFHTRIMRKRPDIKAIVHTHPSILTAFAIVKNGMLEKPWLPEPAMEIGPILMVPYETPLSEKLSQRFDAVIEDSNGFLMENHGALFCSPVDIFDAVELLNMAECMATSVATALAINPNGIQPISPQYIREIDNVIAVRNLRIPGAPGRFGSCSELFGLDVKV